jgi:hypothetical protein
VFESRPVHECLPLLNVAYCHVEVSATGRSLVKRTPTECGVSECDREASIVTLWLTSICCAMGKNDRE